MDVRLINTVTGAVLQEYDNVANGVLSATLFGTPPDGTATYALQVRMSSATSTGNAFCLNRALTAEVMKR